MCEDEDLCDVIYAWPYLSCVVLTFFLDDFFAFLQHPKLHDVFKSVKF
jgi:hypothetical protein